MYYLISDLKNAIDRFAFGRVLDIGCGNKPYEQLFENRVSGYIGCDVIQSDKNKVDVICEATQLLFDNSQFDTVFSTQVMEHVDDPGKMLSESARVLKKGGHLIFSVPFCWELHEEPFDFYRYSKYGLKTMLEREGFEIDSIKANGGKWAAIAQMNINMIYSTFKRRSLFIRFLKLLFIKFHFTAIFNSLAIGFDRKFHDELLTLNYVVTATKK